MIHIVLSKVMWENHIRQQELVAKTGLNKNTIFALYHDLSDRVSLHDIDIICQTLGCEFSDLFEYEPGDIRSRPLKMTKKLAGEEDPHNQEND